MHYAATALLAFVHGERDEDGEDYTTEAYVGGMLAAELVEVGRLFLEAHVEAGKKARRRGRRG